MRPVIGVTSDYNGGDRPEFGGKEPTAFIRTRYINAIEACGGVPMVLPPVNDAKMAKEILTRLDGLLLTGSGPDIDPALYGERQRFSFKKVDPKRTSLERELVKRACEKEMPILGICGGMQLLNVAGGGSLYQDIPGQVPSALKHDHGGKPSHSIEIKRGTLLARIVGQIQLFVNSSHHQGVKEVAPGYVVNAMAEDGVIEGIESADFPFVVGVQWHPEYLHQEDQSRTIFKAFLKRAARFRKAEKL